MGAYAVQILQTFQKFKKGEQYKYVPSLLQPLMDI